MEDQARLAQFGCQGLLAVSGREAHSQMNTTPVLHVIAGPSVKEEGKMLELPNSDRLVRCCLRFPSGCGQTNDNAATSFA